MATQIQHRRGTTAGHSSFTGAAGEITIDTDKNTVVVHDGSTAGGYALAKSADTISELSEDTTPQLGGNLDGQGNDIYSLQANIGSDSGDYLVWTTNTQLDFYVNGSNEMRLESDGDLHVDGDVVGFSTTVSSDEKLKTGIVNVNKPLDTISKLNGVEFTWKKDGTRSAGVIAQDVYEVMPYAVKEVADLKNADTHLTVNYNALHSLYIESIKQLKDRVEELEAKLK